MFPGVFLNYCILCTRYIISAYWMEHCTHSIATQATDKLWCMCSNVVFVCLHYYLLTLAETPSWTHDSLEGMLELIQPFLWDSQDFLCSQLPMRFLAILDYNKKQLHTNHTSYWLASHKLHSILRLDSSLSETHSLTGAVLATSRALLCLIPYKCFYNTLDLRSHSWNCDSWLS